MAVARVAATFSRQALSSTTRMLPSVAARDMATGTVKWFNVTKGFGFISPDDKSQPDVFVHQSVVQSNGFRYLREEEKVTYDVEKTEKGAQAANVRDADGKPFERPVQAREGGERRQGGNGGGDRRPRSPRGPRAPREE